MLQSHSVTDKNWEKGKVMKSFLKAGMLIALLQGVVGFLVFFLTENIVVSAMIVFILTMLTTTGLVGVARKSDMDKILLIPIAGNAVGLIAFYYKGNYNLVWLGVLFILALCSWTVHFVRRSGYTSEPAWALLIASLPLGIGLVLGFPLQLYFARRLRLAIL